MTAPDLTPEQRETLSVAAMMNPDSVPFGTVVDLVARMVADARTQTREEVADAWQQGGWTVLNRMRNGTSQSRLSGAQIVTDWLRSFNSKGDDHDRSS